MKQNDSFAEPRFPVRSYGKGELAMYYLPGIAQQTAVNRLNEWIRTAPGLEQRLLATGMNPYCRRYTPAATMPTLSESPTKADWTTMGIPKTHARNGSATRSAYWSALC